MSFREENANTLVSKVLSKLLGKEVRGEGSGRSDKRLVDIYIPDIGVAIEAKYNDFPAAVKAAQARWTNMNPPPSIVGALSYCPDFKKDPEKYIRQDNSIEFALSGIPHEDLFKLKRVGTVYDLAQSLRRPAAILHPQEDEIEEAVGCIEGALTDFYNSVQNDRGTLHKFATILQATFEPKKEKETLEQSARVAGLILFGAFLFQFALSRKHPNVEQPSVDSTLKLLAHWEYILNEINYAAIFGVAKRILETGILKTSMYGLLEAASDVQLLAQDGMDLMGRIYHRLLIDAKPLGAFYTSISAATLIAGLALSPKNWGDDSQWADLNFIRKFRIADPACGSGTLLAAACWQMRDNFARADFKTHGVLMEANKVNPLDTLQKYLLEEVIWGYDILETAGHLTATTMGLITPNVDFSKAHIYRTIIGITDSGAAAGSLEMFVGSSPIFHRDRHSQVETASEAEKLPELDLCIMNPPFVRGQKDNLAYSFLGKKEQKAVKQHMNKLAKLHGYSNDKGLGPAFVALACHEYAEKIPFIKEGGRIAVILPATSASGMGCAWSNTRKKIEKDFDLETLIVSRDSERPNFSENTALQECIFIAKKRKRGTKPKTHALFVVLHKNPTNSEQALAVVQSIITAKNSSKKYGDLQPYNGQMPLQGKIGEFAKLPYYGKSAWRGTSFSNIRLSFVAENFLTKGNLSPYAKGQVNLVPLNNIAIIGGNTLHLKLNHDDFRSLELVNYETPYPAYYPSYHRKLTGEAHKEIGTISEKPHGYVMPLLDREEWADEFYKKAGRIVLNESFRFNTARRLAALVSKFVQASHYWPIKLKKSSVRKLKALTLWLNSTPALLLIVSAAQSTDGAKVGFSQKAAKELKVINLEELSSDNLRRLATVFDSISKGESLLPLPLMENDTVRKRIDDVISEVCGLGDMKVLRAALAKEPIITNQSSEIWAD